MPSYGHTERREYAAAVLFADLVGSSGLPETERLRLRRNLADCLGRSGGIERRHDLYHVNTWGDSVFTVVSNCHLALWTSHQLQKTTKARLRIGLDFGLVRHDPYGIFDGWDGEPIIRSARIEPVAQDGHIWGTKEFLDEWRREVHFPSFAKCFEQIEDERNLGIVGLAKGYEPTELVDITAGDVKRLDLPNLKRRHNLNPSALTTKLELGKSRTSDSRNVLFGNNTQIPDRHKWDEASAVMLARDRLGDLGADLVIVGSPRVLEASHEFLEKTRWPVGEFAFVWGTLASKMQSARSFSIGKLNKETIKRMKVYGVPGKACQPGLVWRTKFGVDFRTTMYLPFPLRHDRADMARDLRCVDYAVIALRRVATGLCDNLLRSQPTLRRKRCIVCPLAGYRGPGTLGAAHWLCRIDRKHRGELSDGTALLLRIDYRYGEQSNDSSIGDKNDPRKIESVQLVDSIGLASAAKTALSDPIRL